MLGTKDRLIPVEVAEAYVEKMREAGSRCELELYEGVGHGFFNYNYRNQNLHDDMQGPRYYYETLERAERFLESLGYL